MNTYPRTRPHQDIDTGNYDTKSTSILNNCAPCGLGQLKWTSTVSQKVLLEVGTLINKYWWNVQYEPEVTRAGAGNAYGDIAKLNLLTGRYTNAWPQEDIHDTQRIHVVGSLTYVPGSHAFKTGMEYSTGYIKNTITKNGDLVQLYRNGRPDSVAISNTPVQDNLNVAAELGLYAQDSWTIGRLTVNPGVRLDHLRGSVGEQSAPAGRFVPARHFDPISNLPNWTDVSPRFGLAYDIFGNGRTALKGSVGRYMQQEYTGFASAYNPMVSSTDTRTWNDLNGDDIAQESELGPTTNLGFGTRRNRNPDPNIKRPYQVLSNLSLEHELRPGLRVSAAYNHRQFYRLIWTDNLATSFDDDYSLITIADPRGNGTLPVYNLSRNKLGLVNELDTNSDKNTRVYNGVDFGFNARLANGVTFIGGTSTGKDHIVSCQVEDPNNLRGCDQKYPFRTQLKLSGTYPLPRGVRLSAVFQSLPGYPSFRTGDTVSDLVVNYLVNRSIVPNLTLAQVAVRLNEPGQNFLDRVNQLDVSVAKDFRSGRVNVRPQLDLLNALNSAPVTGQITTFGPSLGFPLTVLPARLLRFGVKLDF